MQKLNFRKRFCKEMMTGTQLRATYSRTVSTYKLQGWEGETLKAPEPAVGMRPRALEPGLQTFGHPPRSISGPSWKADSESGTATCIPDSSSGYQEPLWWRRGAGICGEAPEQINWLFENYHSQDAFLCVCVRMRVWSHINFSLKMSKPVRVL